MTRKKNTDGGNGKGIGRSAITGRFMSVSSAREHKKTAVVEGASVKKRK